MPLVRSVAGHPSPAASTPMARAGEGGDPLLSMAFSKPAQATLWGSPLPAHGKTLNRTLSQSS